MQILDWTELGEAARTRTLARPALLDPIGRETTVAGILRAVREDGDAALRNYTRCFDGVDIETFEVAPEAITAAERSLDASTRAAIDRAFDTIGRFHVPSGKSEYRVETAPGVVCRRVVRPLAAVGLYVPGGSAPLPSTVLMLGVPAMLAGCETRVLCTPPDADGNVAPAILYAAERCGITRIFRAGGAQAIAAMAFGTETLPRVDRIFGPGNGWVTEAKRQVAQDPEGALSDLPAGPSELLVLADEHADPLFVAADLLSQAEHGPDSQVLLVTTSVDLARRVGLELERQLAELPREAIARQSLDASRIICVPDIATALAVSNRYAPEHLILNVADPEGLLPEVRNAGSVFLGAWTPESLGDYASGTNHVLPTYGYARQLSGLSVGDFQKSFTVQSATSAGLAGLGPAVIALARAEGLEAHARAVSRRLEAGEHDREPA
ncbi:MAG TPA: histidinol dehydrogenase [Woeseiaceae bacterium]|nr:histidinol dehydrogenase [Woeseiaceae bacterium]